MTKKITSVLLVILLLCAFFMPSMALDLNASVPVSVGVVKKDLETKTVKKLVYSQDEHGNKSITELDQWEDNANVVRRSPLTTESSLMNTRGVIGADGRTLVTNTRQFPYSAIVHLEIHFGLEVRYGTGFFISDNIIATAGHCLYNDELGWATFITVRPGRNGLLSIPYGLATSDEIAVSIEWHDSYDPSYDWGAFSINLGIIGNPGIFTLSTVENNSPDLLDVKISGYPHSDELQKYKQYEMNGPVSVYDSFRFRYTIDTYGGQSGSPLLTSNNIVIGIHRGGSDLINEGVRINESMLFYLNEFIAEND